MRFKLSKTFIKHHFKNLPAFEVQSPDIFFFLPKLDPHPWITEDNILSKTLSKLQI